MVLGERETEILKAVAGSKPFQADAGKDREVVLVRFQQTVRRILKLERDGYLEGVRTIPENETGKSYTDFVSVNGLTPKGRRYLESIGFKLLPGEAPDEAK